MCKAPGCYQIAEDGSRFCSKHSNYEIEKPTYQISKPNIPYRNAERPNDEFYRTSQWRILRKKVIVQHPFCCICGSEENLTVDHIQPPKGDSYLFFDDNNLQVLCRDCHNRKTEQETLILRKHK